MLYEVDSNCVSKLLFLLFLCVKDFVEQAKLYTDVSDHRRISLNALEELVHKQTKEIQSLKSELASEREQSAARVREASAELARVRAADEERVQQLRAEHERAALACTEQRAQSAAEVDTLRRKAEESEARASSLAEENRSYFNELQGLRRYVNDSLPTMQTIKDMTEERRTYEEQIVKARQR